ncbi:uncharacterized protein LOC135828743 [Sycon ciliatum]|uniref:uncharacterized protein LOC135828743 n=1 Tax=Sycon ciliatum TaxID=27933 RepID=UPI0031F65FCB
MIAPSPSWFVGVDAVPLCIGNAWVQSAVYDITAWDSGADGGRNYTSPDDTLTPYKITRRIRSTRGTNVFNDNADDSKPMARLYIDLKTQDVGFENRSRASTSLPTCSKCSETCSAESYDWTINKPVSQTLGTSSAGSATFSALALLFCIVAAMLA